MKIDRSDLGRTPHPAIVTTTTDYKDHIRVLLYSLYTIITECGVLLREIKQPMCAPGRRRVQAPSAGLLGLKTRDSRLEDFGDRNPLSKPSFQLICHVCFSLMIYCNHVHTHTYTYIYICIHTHTLYLPLALGSWICTSRVFFTGLSKVS